MCSDYPIPVFPTPSPPLFSLLMLLLMLPFENYKEQGIQYNQFTYTEVEVTENSFYGNRIKNQPIVYTVNSNNLMTSLLQLFKSFCLV